MQITASLPRPLLATAPPLPSPAASPAPPVETVEPREPVGVSLVRYTAGAVGGVVGVITHGCAGGAHGMLRGAELEPTASPNAFQAVFAANLAVAGAVFYGAAAAVGVVITGEGTWARQDEGLKQQLFGVVDQNVDKALTSLPESASHGIARRAAQAAVGEAVGLATGALFGAQNGYQAGAAFGVRAANFVARTYQQATSKTGADQ